MKHYPTISCPCGTQYNPVKMGKLRPCPNEFCSTNQVVATLPEEVAFEAPEPVADVTNFEPFVEPEPEPTPKPKKAPAKKAAAKKTKGK